MRAAVVRDASTPDLDGQPASQDPVLRQKQVQELVELGCLKYHSWHILTSTGKGKDLGFELVPESRPDVADRAQLSGRSWCHSRQIVACPGCEIDSIGDQ